MLSTLQGEQKDGRHVMRAFWKKYLYFHWNVDFLAKQINLNLKALDSSYHCNFLCELQLRCHMLLLCSQGKAFCLAYPLHNMLFPSRRRGGCMTAQAFHRKHHPATVLGAEASRRMQHLNHNSHEMVWCHFVKKKISKGWMSTWNLRWFSE